MRLVGLYREAEYSPGRHRSNDALLLEQVASVLRTQGRSVDLMTADAAATARPEAELVFSMCQGRRALDLLAEWEQEGTRFINSPRASLNTYRDRLPALMQAAGFISPTDARDDRTASDLPGPVSIRWRRRAASGSSGATCTRRSAPTCSGWILSIGCAPAFRTSPRAASRAPRCSIIVRATRSSFTVWLGRSFSIGSIRRDAATPDTGSTRPALGGLRQAAPRQRASTSSAAT